MPNHSFNFRIANFGWENPVVPQKTTTDELSEKRSALVPHENPPISEIVVVTEISRGLGRRIPLPSEETFAGIVNIQHDSVHVRFYKATFRVFWVQKFKQLQ